MTTGVMAAKEGHDGSEASSSRPHVPVPQVTCVGAGLPPLAQKLVDRILARQYVDFTELPPAKGKGRPVAQPGEGQLVLLQASDLVHARKTIPDFATWGQCFAIYVAVLAGRYPDRLVDLMGYLALIAKVSRRYNWPAWVIYDQQFRQEAAGNPSLQWAKVDPGLYAQCFTGQEACKENWCSSCQELDHKSVDCPFRPRKRAWNAGYGQGEQSGKEAGGGGKHSPQVCLKFNRYGGDCKYGRECKFAHVCAKCRGAHPAGKCSGQ